LFFLVVLQEKFKTGLLAQSEDFKKQVNSLVEEFHSKGPFSSAVNSENALALIANMRTQLQGLKDQEQQLRRGLGIFKIDQPPSKDITRMEHVSVGFHQLTIVMMIATIISLVYMFVNIFLLD